jgi:oligogalacturonide lyase
MYPSEMKTLKDSKTGHTVIQLTGDGSNNYHLYFTENSFCKGAREIIFYSDRASPGYNLFSMNLDTGAIRQLTDFTGHISHCVKPPGGEQLFCFHADQIVRIDTLSLEQKVLYECPPAWRLTSMSLNSSGNRIGFILNENVKVTTGANYSGFTESMYAVKRSKIMSVPADGGSAVELFQDTHQLGHFQFAPDDDTVAMYCHEGPWHLVHQRIWLLDLISRTVTPCFRQEADDSVGHEFWTRDNLIFFDNRRAGHDGTITSSKTQIYKPAEDKKQTPYIGFADKQGAVIRTVDMPFYCNHYHADNTNAVLVGDDVEDLLLIRIDSGKAEMQTLCFHGTSWYGQTSHCHPTFCWDGAFVLWTSDFGGRHNIYLIDVRQAVWR